MNKVSFFKFKPKLTKLTLLFMVLIFLPSIIFSQNINIIVNNSFMPYVYPDSSGKATGASIIYLQKILDKTDIKYHIELAPLKRMLLNVYKSDSIGCAIFRTKERESEYRWIIPITPHIKSVLIKLKSRTDIKVKDIEDAKKYTIGVVNGNNIQTKLLELGFDNNQLKEVTTNEQNIKKLFSNRVDMIAIRELGINTEIVQLGFLLSDVEIATVINDDGEAWVIGNKTTSEDVIIKIQNAYSKVRNEITIDNFTDTYVKETFQGKIK